MKNILDLDKFADGALAERFNSELQKVLENVQDHNTEATKTRKIQLNITVTPNDKRNLANISVIAKTTLATATEINGDLLLDFDKNGKATGAELKSGIPGQTYIDNDGDPATDTGQKVNDLDKKRASNAVAFK